MAKIISKYLSDDGKEFDTAEAADAHNASIQHAKLIEAYIVHAKLEKAQAGLLRKHLAGFIAFEASYVPSEEPAPAPVAEQAAEAPQETATEGAAA